jgi:hypothetical protein
MNFYYFGNESDVDNLIKNKFCGILFTYNAKQSDYFSYSARNLNLDQDFKYMVAVRPHVISPQYLAMIFRGFNKIKTNSLQLNIISGHVKEEEKGWGGILGDINDFSSQVDRSNYLIKHINVLDDLNKKEKQVSGSDLIDFYVSTTNNFVFNAAQRNKNKMIIAYSDYKNDSTFIINPDDKVMLSMGPVIRDTQEELDAIDKKDRKINTNDTVFFTKEQLTNILNDIQNKHKGIEEILFFAWPQEEKERIFNFVNEYKNKEKEINK